MIGSGAVLAGGRSSRMGRDKAWLPFAGEPMIRRVVRRLESCCSDLFVVAKDPVAFAEAGLPAVPDAVDIESPIAGVLTALRCASTPLVLVVACDMPFVSCAVAGLLAERIGDRDAAVPKLGGRIQPMHAMWRTSALAGLEELVEDGVRAVGEALHRLGAEEVEEADWRSADPEALSMLNVNTPGDLEQAVRLA